MTLAADLARACFQAALASVDPYEEMINQLERAPLDAPVTLLAVGKAALPMAAALCAHAQVAQGAVTVPAGYAGSWPGRAVPLPICEAGHPIPTPASMRAGRQAKHMAAACGAGERLVVALSGGGSALWTVPAAGLTLDDLIRTHQVLLRSGASIEGVNVVRKHLSSVKGGWLAEAAYPGSVSVFGLSDVPGDDFSILASGPFSPDASRFEDAITVLRQAGGWGGLPERVRAHLEAGRAGAVPETPKAMAVAFEHVTTALVGSNAQAVQAAAACAQRAGYRAYTRAEVQGEAAQVGRMLGRIARRAAPGTAFVWGGESTVTVRGPGQGGRNQEVALAAAAELAGAPHGIAVLSAGTDGIDGPTDAAGAVVTQLTADAILQAGADLDEALAANDSYPLLDRLGCLLRTGPTHTNVRDVMIAVVGAPEDR